MEDKEYQRLADIEERISSVQESVEKMRRSITLLILLTTAFLILPLVGVVVLVAMLVNSVT